MELQVDHVSFPVYNNRAFLGEVEESWKRLRPDLVSEVVKTPEFSAVFHQGRSFYVEHLSTLKGDGYWSNTIYVVVDKKYWDHYESPDRRNDHWLKPKMHGGFAVFPPESPFLNSKQPAKTYDGFKILISRTLEAELAKLCGLKWELPAHLAVDERLLHAYDMAVINENHNLIAPLHQCNYPLDYWEYYPK